MKAAANVVTHAYPDTDGDITLTIRQANQTIIFEVSDDRVGTAARTPRPGPGVGTQIIDTLSDATFQSPDGSGARVTMRLPCAPR